MITYQSGWRGITSAHWTTKRLKDVGVSGLINGIFKTKDQFGSGVRLVNVGDLYQDSKVIDNEKLDRVNTTTSEIDRYRVLAGDIFFVRSSLKLEGVGVSAIFENNTEPTVFECHVIRFRPNQKKIYPKFAIYQLNSNEIKRKLIVASKTVTMTTISQDKISTIDIAYPSLEEQQSVADYLDAKTKQIDRKIELLEQKAEKYIDLKKSLINETVTRGLDIPVPMKDSGVEWIGEIPSHWEVSSVTKITKVVSIKDHPEEELLSVYRDYGVIVKSDRDDNHNKPGENLSGYKLVKPGFLVINKMKAWQGSLGISKYRGIVSPAYITCEVSKNIEHRYLHHLLRCRTYINEYNRLSYGVRNDQWDMRYDDFKYIPVLLPPFDEQKRISDYLDEKFGQINRIIETIHLEVEKLKELRKTLINDVVTGKIRVSGGTVHE